MTCTLRVLSVNYAVNMLSIVRETARQRHTRKMREVFFGEVFMSLFVKHRRRQRHRENYRHTMDAAVVVLIMPT